MPTPEAPNAKELKKTKLNKVKTHESSGDVAEADKKPFKKIWDECGGDYKKVKKHDRFKGMTWRDNFEPKDADHFAVGVLKGLCFDD